MKPLALILAGIVAAMGPDALAQSATTQPAARQEPAVRGSRSSQRALGQRLREFRVDGIPLREVISILSDTSGANFHIRWNQLETIGVDRDTPVSVELRNVTLAKLLQVILDSVSPPDYSLGYYVHENVITVYISHSQRTDLMTRVYDITDLMFLIPDIEPGEYGDSAGGRGRDGNSRSDSGNRRSGRGSRMSRY